MKKIIIKIMQLFIMIVMSFFTGLNIAFIYVATLDFLRTMHLPTLWIFGYSV